MVPNTIDRPTSVIEVLSKGFELVASRWHLFLIPLLLDFFLLFGPQVDLNPALNQVSYLSYVVVQNSVEATLGERYLVEQADYHSMLVRVMGGEHTRYLPNLGAPSLIGSNLQAAILAHTDPNSWLAGSQALQFADPLVWTQIGIPSLLAGRTVAAPPLGVEPAVMRITTPFGLATLFGGTYTFGFLGGAIYLMLIAAHVTQQPMRIIVAKLPRYITRLIGVMAVAIILGICVGGPFWVLAAVVSLQSVPLGMFTLSLGSVVILWCLLFVAFAGYGVLLHERPPLPAIWDSVRVVQWYLPATALLLVLVLLIDFTLTRIWLIFNTGWMILPGIVGHAIVSAALMSSLVVYYHDRHHHWAEERARLIKELRKRRAGKAR